MCWVRMKKMNKDVQIMISAMEKIKLCNRIEGNEWGMYKGI